MAGCPTPCSSCTCCNIPSEAVTAAYEKIKTFFQTNYNDIKAAVAAALVKEDAPEGKFRYTLPNAVFAELTEKYMLASTVAIWTEAQQWRIPLVCIHIVDNILREAYLRGEAVWKPLYYNNELRVKITLGEFFLEQVNSSIKVIPPMSFNNYDELFEGMDLTPRCEREDYYPYGTDMQWKIYLDWVKLLQKSVNLTYGGSAATEVPVADVFIGYMIYRCVQLAIEDHLFDTERLAVGDFYLYYNSKYVVAKLFEEQRLNAFNRYVFRKVTV